MEAEPFAVVVAPNGEYFAVTGFRSGTVKFFDADAPYAELASIELDWNLNRLPTGVTIADADEDRDTVRFTPALPTMRDQLLQRGMAPATGRLMAQLLRGMEPNIDVRPYRIDRFG